MDTSLKSDNPVLKHDIAEILNQNYKVAEIRDEEVIWDARKKKDVVKKEEK